MELEPRFRVRGWLSEDEFKELLEFSKYIGRERGTSIFELDEKKMTQSGLGPADALRLLEGLKDKIVPEDYDLVHSYLMDKGSVNLALGGDRLLISSKAFLKPIIHEFGRPEVKYDSGSSRGGEASKAYHVQG